MSIISFYGVTLILAGNRLLDAVDWNIKAQDRIALVGRNGAGKSTLLKLLQGDLVADSGQINLQSGLRIAGLVQEVPVYAETETVYHFLVQSLGKTGEVLAEYQRLVQGNDLDKLAVCQQEMDNLHAWELLAKVETMASKLGINPQDYMKNLSGGMKRRVLLAAALIAAPDLLLLDEPTNHLDMDAIEWLESYIKSYSGSVLVVTHDRAFLNQVSNRIVEIDRGKLNNFDCDYESYLDRREAMRLSEQKSNNLFDKRLAEEEVWIRTGIRARRTRNEGRVRALEAMRKAHKERLSQLGKMKTVAVNATQQSGVLVIEAEHLNYRIGERKLIKDFSFLLTRGDKVGIIGPNGCGKTTLIRLLLGQLEAESGQVRQGTALAVAYFDQLRSQLDDNQTLMANVGDGADYVTINGQQKHVASYLREFLFSPDRFNQLVSTLSGGERNRLLLAKLLAKPVNLLVMDEPTNDLDIETLELLESMIADYPGTLLLISHDREFIDQVVTSILVYEGEGQFNEYVGGYKDYKNLKKLQRDTPAPTVTRKKSASGKLNFNEQRELSAIPQQIEVLEEKIAEMHESMANSEFYQQSSEVITEHNRVLSVHEEKLAQLYERWMILEEK